MQRCYELHALQCSLIGSIFYNPSSRRRFTCQLAITDTPMIDVKPPPTAAKPIAHRHSLSVEHAAPEHANSQLNVGFSIDFQSHYKNPLRSVAEVRHRILDHDVDLGDIPLDIKPMPNPAVEGLKQDGVESPFGSMYDISSFDTFEDCLHVSNQMDSILSYYYSEEGTNTVKIMEIFPLKGEPSAYSGYVPVPISERRGLPLSSHNASGMDNGVQDSNIGLPSTPEMKRAATYAAPLYDAM